MRISEISVKRPVAISMVIIGILVFGFVSLTRLAVDLYPELDFPIAVAITNYPGAGPEEIENQVSRPIEEVLGTVNNVESISSNSLAGTSMVLAWFNWGTDMDVATQHMREKIDRIKPFLPEDVDSPMILKVDPASMPIVQIGISADRDVMEVKQIVEDKVKKRLERTEGVASVSITGGMLREIQVLVDPHKLDYYGVSLSQISGVLRGENVNLSNGELEDGNQLLFLRTLGEFKSISEIENISITSPTGTIIKLKDIAKVVDGHEKATQITRVDGINSVGVHVLKQTDANIVKVAESVREELEALKKELPSDFEVKIMVDLSQFISDSIDQVIRNTVIGGILAVVVLFLFLRNLRSTLVIGLSIPISIIATFSLIYFNGLTLNIMSLGGLALGVGMMVDNSIVILENIYRFRQKGHGMIEAAVKGSAEVGSAVIASTLTTVAVFLPMVFVEGIAGQMFKQLALTVTFSLLCSLFAAVTLVPMLASKLIKTTEHVGKTKWFNKMLAGFNSFFDKLDELYRRLLVWSLRRRWTTMGIVILALIASLALIPFVGAEFTPKVDTGEIAINVELPKGASLQSTTEIVNEVEQRISDIPEKKAIFTSIGSSGQNHFTGASEYEKAQIRLSLVKKSEREKSTEVITDEVRNMLTDIPGATISVVEDQSNGSPSGGKPIQIKVKGDDIEILNQLTDNLMEVVKNVEGTREVESSLEGGQPELQLKIDRERAGRLGLSVSQIANTVKAAVSGQVAGQYRVGGDEYDIKVMLDESARSSLNDIANLTVAAPNGALVPIKDVVTFTTDAAPNSIDREDQVRLATVSADIVGRDLGSITKDLQAKLKNFQLPQGYEIEMGGQDKDMMESFIDLAKALVLSILLVYMVMAAQFESLLYPFIIMFSLPTTFIGVIWGLFLTGRALSVPAFIGIIMLAGIVVNNGIVLVDYINTLRSRGMERNEAIIEAGPTRLRPILMTTLTTVLGMVPLALGIGEGGESQAPMATVVVFGLTTSALFTLTFVPVVYTLLDDLSNWLKRKMGLGDSIKKEEQDVVSMN